jgi:hypothetical protein
VHLEIDLQPGESFNSWSGVDGQDGKTAFVAMVSDRHVGTDIDYPNDWEKAGAVLSSVAQRTLGLLATVTTGFILAQAAALAVTALAVRGIAALAGVLGASGAVVQALTAAADYADAQLRIANATALCMSRWAAGGSGTLSQGDNTGGAATGAAGTAVSIGTSIYAGTKGATDASKAGIGAVANPVDWIDAYGSHAENYLQDPTEAWSSIGDIGGCIQAEMESAQVALGLRPGP